MKLNRHLGLLALEIKNFKKSLLAGHIKGNRSITHARYKMSQL